MASTNLTIYEFVVCLVDVNIKFAMEYIYIACHNFDLISYCNSERIMGKSVALHNKVLQLLPSTS